MERHQVQVAFDGLSGFKAAEEARPEVVILDIGIFRCVRLVVPTSRIFAPARLMMSGMRNAPPISTS